MPSIAAYRPRFSIDEATDLAHRLYDVMAATCEELPSERDQNFYIRGRSGEERVLKISSSAEQREVLDFQNKAMVRLGERHGSGIWPRVYPANTSDLITTVDNKDGATHMVRMLTYIPGVPLANVNPHSPELLHSLGNFLGQVSQALEGFTHSGAHRELKWNMDNGPAILRADVASIPDAQRRSLIEYYLEQYETHVVPRLPSLRRSVIHNDGNDYNVLVGNADPNDPASWTRRVGGLIDFGDTTQSYTVCEPAVALAYVMLGKAAPLTTAAHVLASYHHVHPLTEQEIELLYYFICMRLCMSVTISARQQKDEPAHTYLSVSEQPAWDLLVRLRHMPAALAHYVFRGACGMPPCPQTAAVVQWLQAHQDRIGPVLGPDVDITNSLVFDLSVGSPELALLKDRDDIHETADLLFSRMRSAGAAVGIGRYNEPRGIYTGELFSIEHDEIPESRTIHLGLDLFMKAGTPVFAPLDGTIHSFQNNTEHLDYGPTIIMQHETDDDGATFYTLYGHLSVKSLDGLHEGMRVKRGDRIATLGDPRVNGGWPPHLHFQIITDLLGRTGDFPGVASPGQRAVWLSVAPDPNIIVGIPAQCFPVEARSRDDILRSRRQHIGTSLSISYNTPIKIVRGYMQYLYDEVGHAYLDAVNNVPHVGHSHPRVVEAGQRQMAVLNTNTRYLYDNLTDYAERLCSMMPDPLNVCFFVNSGSEANDLALRMARTCTGRQDMIVLNGAYHGNLRSLIEISPYKFDGAGGRGAPPHVHKVEMPDPYRGRYKGHGPAVGIEYAKDVKRVIGQVRQQTRDICAFIAEPLLSCGGQIVMPVGYLAEAYQIVREVGGVCIADEVQVGFGRVGTHFWGFETQGVVPDIVTLGKPMGNGHPLAAVITTPEIADTFDDGMEYFNTYGGNPVSCAIGMAVLDVIRDENLQENALRTGNRMMEGLRQLMHTYPLVGDVRGLGLFIGVELVLNHESLEPARTQASYIANRMKDHGILISTDGPLHNVLKIKPPLVFTEENADRLVNTLDKILREDFARV